MFRADRVQHNWQVINRDVEHVSVTGSMNIGKHYLAKRSFYITFNHGSVFAIPNTRFRGQILGRSSALGYIMIYLSTKVHRLPTTNVHRLKHIRALFIYGSLLPSLQRTKCVSQRSWHCIETPAGWKHHQEHVCKRRL